MEVDIIKIPINVGCGREGAQDGPENLVCTVLESGKTIAIALVEFNSRLPGRDKTAAVMKHIVESITKSL